MQVTALAEVLMSARRSDGAVSLEDLKLRLSRAGLDELVNAVTTLARRVKLQKPDKPAPEPIKWS